MSLRDENSKNDGSVERSKVALGRTPPANNRVGGKPWWRITVYVGDTAEELDRALEEALRLDLELSERFR